MKIKTETIKQVIPDVVGIDGREDYLKTAVLVLLHKKNGVYHLILEKRAMQIRQGGEVSFAGGKFDLNLDQTLKDTAVREGVEELGIEASSIHILGELDTVFAPIGVMIQPFLAIIDEEDISFNPNKAEVDYLLEIPIDWLLKTEPKKYFTLIKAHPYEVDDWGNVHDFLPVKELGLPERYTKPWGHLKQSVYVYEYEGEVIWGLTARMIRSFTKKLAQYIE